MCYYNSYLTTCIISTLKSKCVLLFIFNVFYKVVVYSCSEGMRCLLFLFPRLCTLALPETLRFSLLKRTFRKLIRNICLFFSHRKLFDLQCFSTLASTCSSFVVDCCFLLGLDSSRAEDVDQFCSKLMHLSSSIRLNDYLNWREKKLSKWERHTSFL